MQALYQIFKLHLGLYSINCDSLHENKTLGYTLYMVLTLYCDSHNASMMLYTMLRHQVAES